MKKNITVILAAFLLALSFNGCDKKDVNDETSSADFQEITETENEKNGESTDDSLTVSQVSEKYDIKLSLVPILFNLVFSINIFK